DAGRFIAAFEQPLHPDANAEQRLAVARRVVDRGPPRLIEPRRRAEVADAGHDDRIGAAAFVRRGWHEVRSAQRRERLLHRGEVAGSVIDERDHNNPFVLGSIFASRASFAHATRSALANALNTASM